MLLPPTIPASVHTQSKSFPLAHVRPANTHWSLAHPPVTTRPAIVAAKAVSDTETQPSATATVQLDTSLRLHPDATARRQKAQRRQEQRNNIVALRKQLKTEGRGRALHPKVEQLAQQNTDVLFLKANVEQMPELANTLQITSMPWFMFYKGAGEPVANFTASLQPNRLAKLRAEIALHKC